MTLSNGLRSGTICAVIGSVAFADVESFKNVQSVDDLERERRESSQRRKRRKYFVCAAGAAGPARVTSLQLASPSKRCRHLMTLSAYCECISMRLSGHSASFAQGGCYLLSIVGL